MRAEKSQRSHDNEESVKNRLSGPRGRVSIRNFRETNRPLKPAHFMTYVPGTLFRSNARRFWGKRGDMAQYLMVYFGVFGTAGRENAKLRNHWLVLSFLLRSSLPMPGLSLSCLVKSSLAPSWLVLSCRVLSCFSCLVLACLILSCFACPF